MSGTGIAQGKVIGILPYSPTAFVRDARYWHSVGHTDRDPPFSAYSSIIGLYCDKTKLTAPYSGCTRCPVLTWRRA
eukprot:179810-Rhodomonas_salina.2